MTNTVFFNDLNTVTNQQACIIIIIFGAIILNVMMHKKMTI